MSSPCTLMVISDPEMVKLAMVVPVAAGLIRVSEPICRSLGMLMVKVRMVLAGRRMVLV